MPRALNCMRHGAAGVALLAAGHVSAQVSPDDATVFRQQCGVCHTTSAAEPARQGPHLQGVVGRKAGSVKGFAYSPAFRKALSGKPWTDALVDRWITDPQAVAPNTVMAYQQADADKRAAVLRYLKTLD